MVACMTLMQSSIFSSIILGDPTKSSVRMWIAPEFEWEDRPVKEFHFPNLSSWHRFSLTAITGNYCASTTYFSLETTSAVIGFFPPSTRPR